MDYINPLKKIIAHGWRKKPSLMNTKGSRSRPLRLASTSVSYTYWFARAAKLKSYYYCIIGHESKLITDQRAIHIMRSFIRKLFTLGLLLSRNGLEKDKRTQIQWEFSYDLLSYFPPFLPSAY